MSASNQPLNSQLLEGLTQFFEDAPTVYLSGIGIDTVLFSFHHEKLKVLLLRFLDTDYHFLPGGYIHKKEDVDAAAYRILQEMTNLTDIYLDQFYTSGSLLRSENTVALNTFKKLGVQLPPGNFLEQRFVTVCYYALVEDTQVVAQPDPLLAMMAEAKWFDVEQLAELPLLFDHKLIIDKALQRFQLDLDQKLVGFNLLPDTFTMGDLQKLHEAVHQTTLDRTSFQRKMLSLNILERLEKKYTGKAHKSPYLYRFAKEAGVGVVPQEELV